MNYSQKFENDYSWFLSVSHLFNFDGTAQYYDKKGNPIIVEDKNGVTAKESFYFWDSQGKIKPTKEPEILLKLLKTKGSINLHIKMYAEDRASGLLCRIDFDELANQINAPKWFGEAVENQKCKYYKNYIPFAS